MKKEVIEELLTNPLKYAKKLSEKELEGILRELAFHYYNKQESLVPDEIFDILVEYMEKLNPNNTFLKDPGAFDGKKISLPYYMPSLEKLKAQDDSLSKWLEKYKGPYVVSDKLDGVSCLLVKNKRGKIVIYKKNNATQGYNISHLAPYVLSKNIEIPNDTAIRGELIIPKTNHEYVMKTKGYKIPLAGVVAVVNSKPESMPKDIAKLIHFVAYSVIHPQMKKDKQMECLKQWKLHVVNYQRKEKIDNKVLNTFLLERREKGEYNVDGVVVEDFGKKYALTDEKPKYAKAYKSILDDQQAETIVTDVEWAISKDNRIVPTVIFTPVILLGKTVKRATGFNGKFIVDNKIGPGAVIRVIISGDVIPKIMKVLKPSATDKPKLPSVSFKWDKTGVNMINTDVSYSSKRDRDVRSLMHFFKTLKIANISEGVLTKLYDNGYITLVKIIGMKKEEYEKIDGLGTKVGEKIIENMKTAFPEVRLHSLMDACNVFGGGLGSKKLKIITDEYPDIMKSNWSTETIEKKILGLPGFDSITAKKFAQHFPKFLEIYQELKTVTNFPKVDKVDKPKGDKLKGQTIVFTGFRDATLEQEIESQGGKVSSSVSKNTTLVLTTDPDGDSSKIAKAKQLGVKVMHPDKFKKEYLGK